MKSEDTSGFRAICLNGVCYPVNTDEERTTAMAAMIGAGEVLENIWRWPSKTEYDAELDPINTGWLLRAFVP